MPDGVVQWYDHESGQGRVIHSGKRYACTARDMDAAARHAGARVHFDVTSDGTRAVNVTTRDRGRSRRSHRGAGSLAGAHAPWAKVSDPPTTASMELRRLDRTRPMHLLRAWSDAVARGALDDAILMYAPDAVIHTEDGALSGRNSVATVLESLSAFGTEESATALSGDDDHVQVEWARSPVMAPTMVRSRVTNGEIVEQWIHARLDTSEVPHQPRPFPIQVSVHGRVSQRALDYAREKLIGLTAHVNEPVLFTRVKLTQHADPAARRPAVAEAALDINGELVRAHVAADRMMEAVDLLDRRLRDRLAHFRDHRGWSRPNDVVPVPGEWRHGNLPTDRPHYFDRAPQDREIVRHKTWAPDELTVDEAACDLETLDYDFFLFRELATGQDSVLVRVGDGSYRLLQAHPDPTAVEHAVSTVELVEAPPPSADLIEAIEHLNASHEPFVLVADQGNDRTSVLYRRYDGNYGLITPTSSET